MSHSSANRGYDDRGTNVLSKEKYMKKLMSTRNQLVKELAQFSDNASTSPSLAIPNPNMRLPKLGSGALTEWKAPSSAAGKSSIEKGGLTGSIAFPGLSMNNKKKALIKLPIFRLQPADIIQTTKPSTPGLLVPTAVYKHQFIPCTDVKNLRRSLLMMFQKLEPSERLYLTSHLDIQDYELDEAIKNLKNHSGNDNTQSSEIVNDLLEINDQQSLFMSARNRIYGNGAGGGGGGSVEGSASHKSVHTDALRAVSRGMDFHTIGLNDKFTDYLLNNNHTINYNTTANSMSSPLLNRSNSLSSMQKMSSAHSSSPTVNRSVQELPSLGSSLRQESRVASTRDKLKNASTNKKQGGQHHHHKSALTESEIAEFADPKALTQQLLSSIMTVQKHTSMMKKSLETAQHLVAQSSLETSHNTMKPGGMNNGGASLNATNNRAKEVIFMLAAERLSKALMIFIHYELRRGLTAWKQHVTQARYYMKVKRLIKFVATRNILLGIQDKFIRMLYKAMNTWKNFTQQEILRLKKQRILQATILIQGTMRKKLAYKRVKQIRYRLRYERLYSATIKIQSIFRSKRLRWKYLRTLRDMKERAAAIMIQKHYRRHLARKRVKNMRLRKNKHKAATMIQCLIRKFHAKKRVTRIRLQRKQRRAATRIQCIIRGFLARRYVALLITNRVRFGYIVKIQALMRGVLTRMNREKKIKEILEYKEMREKAATKIQSVYRSYRCQIIYRIMLLQFYKERNEQTAAATQIQRIIRGFLARCIRRDLEVERYESWMDQARTWQETWSEEEQNWFYYNHATGESAWEPQREGYTKNDGQLVLFNGETIDDPLKQPAGGRGGDDDGSSVGTWGGEASSKNGKKATTNKKLQSKLCSECTERHAIRKCEQCGDQFCTKCYKLTHALGQRRHHTYKLLGPKDCNECENILAIRFCVACDENFCDGCWRRLHSHGKRVFHPYSEISKEGRVDKRIYTMDGDQLDDKAYDATYMQQRQDNNQISNMAVVLGGEHQASSAYGGGGATSTSSETGYYDTSTGYGEENAYALQTYDENATDAEWATYYDENDTPYYYNNYTGASQYESPYGY